MEVEGRRSGLLRVLPAASMPEVFREQLVLPCRGRLDLVKEEPVVPCRGRLDLVREEPVVPCRGRLDLVRGLLGVVGDRAELHSSILDPVLIFKSDRKLVLGMWSSLLALVSVPMEEKLELFRVAELELVLVWVLLADRLGVLEKLAPVVVLGPLRLAMVVKVGLLGVVMMVEALDLATSEEEFLVRDDFKVRLEANFPLRDMPWLVSLELAVEKLEVSPLVDKRGLVRGLLWLEVAMLSAKPKNKVFFQPTCTNRQAHTTLTFSSERLFKSSDW